MKWRMAALLATATIEETEFKIFVDRRKSVSKTSNLDTGRNNFRLFQELVSKVPWEKIFAGGGVHQC